ncbi:MAG TPA: NAD-dependent epimerase/dehydratase family protein [Acidimicrobiales bacterium]|jgi:nucleoside-diphosphate-sugar epimerase|nr:NAD-dependent epimerase/dehydratase family protein [Acidimicrobiales bacterium]
MRVVVTGATGNVGTSVVRALRDDESIKHVIGLARRLPEETDFLGIEWRPVDVAVDDLVPHFQHADAVIHLAWQLQPERRRPLLHQVNVLGSARVFEAVAKAEIGALLYASSFAAYSPAPPEAQVDESWPTDGIATSLYSQQKAYVERLLDRFEVEHPMVRVVRLRPGLTFKSDAASEIQRLFLGRLLPTLASPLARLSVVPDVLGLARQVVHSDDVAEAYRLALLGSVVGAYNIATEQTIDASTVAKEFGLRALPVGPRLARSAAALTWRLHLQPAEPGWFDLAFQSPLLDVGHARKDLGWDPKHEPFAVLSEFATALASGGGLPTAPLRPGPGLGRKRRKAG